MTATQEPLNPQRLVTILAHLLPPAYPLAPDLLSSAIKTRQLYLPPNTSNPNDDRFIAQRPSSTEEDHDPEDLSSRLKAIAESRLHARDPEFSNEIQLQGEGNDIEVALYREAWNVRYRALDGETLIAKLDLPLRSDAQRGVRILFVPENSEDHNGPLDDSARVQSIGEGSTSDDVGYRSQISMGDEWKLFDVKPLEEALAEEQRTETVKWASSPREAFEGITETKKSGGDGEVGGEDQPEDDYWGGYSDSDKEEEKPTVSGAGKSVGFKADEAEPRKDRAATHEGLPAAVPGGTSSLPAQSYTNPMTNTTQAASPPIIPALNPDANKTLPNPSLPTAVLTKKVTISPYVSRFNTPVHGHGADDAYWSSYGGVEDGLKVSNPPSPRGVSRLSTPAGGYWGTGGESPMSWSPPAPTQTLPPISDNIATASPRETAQDASGVDYQTQLRRAATTAGQRTDAMFASHDGHLDLSSPGLDFAPESPVLEPTTGDSSPTTVANERQTALRAALTGLKFLYINAGDQNQLQGEFAEVLREFM